ncbi:hypothetical protein N7462_006822 [Penicillium macrosclerotiorum]|uniref:uncharacterized protein n=1 Tax=Penicillium macrosclerotiorum TaxID=303699 RepID=UPI00254671E6|nr:uncharacterized protein N7462_006822 [Penicillium macrosclerotiorum]KAJ5678578.1 hypothetical protein N7462_006822 [Penicillium macrosclerotiorum]
MAGIGHLLPETGVIGLYPSSELLYRRFNHHQANAFGREMTQMSDVKICQGTHIWGAEGQNLRRTCTSAPQ